MFGLGFSEILIIGVLALILLGPEQLPDLARKMGRFINDLKRTTDGIKEEFRSSGINPANLLEEIKREHPKNTPPTAATQSPEELMPKEDPAVVLKTGHQEQVTEAPIPTLPTGNDDSGKT